MSVRAKCQGVVTAEQLCKEGKFAEEIARFANLDST
jgi:hypothetical protein